MKKIFQSNLITVLFLFLAAVILSVLVYPEVFITFKTSFILWSDYCAEYPPAFVLTNFLYQGGLQLWDFFAQMPYFHTYVVWGFFKLPTVVTAAAYYVLAAFLGDSGQLFHHVFAWGYLMTLLLIRIVGIFLLLRLVTQSRLILGVGTVVFAVFFSQFGFIVGGFSQSYFPLGMYFIVRFFQDFQWRYLAATVLFFAVVLGSAVHSGGYMYLPMHFFIISGILWRYFFHRQTQSLKPVVMKFWDAKQVAWVLLLVFFILAPYAYMVKFGFPDLAFGQADSRITHPFSPSWYFHNPDMDLGNPSEFFSSILNMQNTEAVFYVGISFLFLALAGLILSRNKLKYFFGFGILFLWLLSFPREGFNIGVVAHWMNVLTNPLKTIPRSYRLSCESMLSYLLMPLAVMGIEAFSGFYRGEVKRFSGFTLGLLGAMMSVLVINGLTVLLPEVRIYLVICLVLLLAGLGWVYWSSSRRAKNFLIAVILVLALTDILLIIHQSKNFTSMMDRKPTLLDAAPQAGMVGFDFENPSIFTYRNFYTFQFSYRDEVDIWFPHGISSDVHHVINQALNYTYLNGINPRHAEFAKWLNDPVMMTYLGENNEFMFLADAAIKASPEGLSRICQAGLSQDVIEVDDPGGRLNLPEQWPAGLRKQGEDFKYSQLLGTLDAGGNASYHREGSMIIETVHVPPYFPGHLASSWFPAEARTIRFLVEGKPGQWQEFQPTQGELIRPNTFDLGNMKKGDLNAAFAMSEFPMYHRWVLLYPSKENQGVEGLWRRQFDNLGVNFRAKKDGWFLAHYPYDPKWQIIVDGRRTDFYRVNQSFIGFPLKHGEHKILIQYWPQSPLRGLLLISAALTILGLPALMFLGLRWEEKRRAS